LRYIYNGVYREFRGYVFTQGKPVEITDRGTLELIKHEPDFKEVPDEEAQEIHPAPQEVLADKGPARPKFDRAAHMRRMHAEGRMRKK